MQNSAVICIISVFERIYSFWLTSVQKIKSVSISWNLVPRLIWICRIQWCRLLFSVFDKIHFLGKLGPKIQSSLFKVKYGTASNSNKQNSMVIFTFCFGLKIFSAKKVKIVSLSWNLVSRKIRKFGIQWWCSFFLFSMGNTLFEEISAKN